MGQEVHRQGLILDSRLDGKTVEVVIDSDRFSLAMLDMHLQMNYSDARMWKTFPVCDQDRVSVVIDFGSVEDAMHFHLRQ